MNCYIYRLIRLGFSKERAMEVYRDHIGDDLDDYIDELEDEADVYELQ